MTPQEVKLRWDKSTFDTMFPIAASRTTRAAGRSRICRAGPSCLARAGRTRTSPSTAAGELYIFSKTDGMIRTVVGAGDARIARAEDTEGTGRTA